MPKIFGKLIKSDTFCVTRPEFSASIYPFVASFAETLARGLLCDLIARLSPLAIDGIAPGIDRILECS